MYAAGLALNAEIDIRSGGDIIHDMSMRHEMLTDWDGKKFPLLSVEEIASLPGDDRERYVTRLHGYDFDNGTKHHARWLDFHHKCAEDGCTKSKYESYRHCIKHVSVDEVDDPNGRVNRRASKAKLRMAEMLEAGVDELEKIITASSEDMAPAVRLKAIDTLFDRANLPRQTAASVDHSGGVTVVSVDAAAVIQARLDRLAGSVISGELAGIEEASRDAG